jgi:[ribosomal protein S5]-alanine N-acetyltransferase
MSVVTRTPRLTLRHFTPADLDALLALYGDPQVMALHPAGPMARPQVEGILAHILHTYDDPGYGFYAVVLNTTGAVIGQCGLLSQEIDGRPEVELAYKILPAYWGGGIASEAARAIRDYGFAHFGFPRLISIVHPQNIASQRVCEKNGMARASDASWHGIKGMQIYQIANPAVSP